VTDDGTDRFRLEGRRGLVKKGVTAPIYLLSSIGDATAANIDIQSLGFKGFFQKPVNPGQLISSIKRAFGA